MNACRYADGLLLVLFLPHSLFFPKGSGPVMDVSFVDGSIMAGLPLEG